MLKYFLKLFLFLSLSVVPSCSTTKPVLNPRSLIVTNESAYYSNDNLSITIAAGSDRKDLLSPEAIKRIGPIYPEEARNEGVEGEVQLKMLVMADGIVKRSIVLTSSNPIFNRAALVASMQWTFRPAMTNGKSINAWVSIPFRFRLR